MSDLSWQASAACGPHTMHLFYTERGGYWGRRDGADAKAICASCSVLAACANDALVNVNPKYGDQYGIRGGMDAEDRAAIREGLRRVCRNQHDMTSPYARSSNGRCKQCRSDAEKEARARRNAVREAAE